MCSPSLRALRIELRRLSGVFAGLRSTILCDCIVAGNGRGSGVRLRHRRSCGGSLLTDLADGSSLFSPQAFHSTDQGQRRSRATLGMWKRNSHIPLGENVFDDLAMHIG